VIVPALHRTDSGVLLLKLADAASAPASRELVAFEDLRLDEIERAELAHLIPLHTDEQSTSGEGYGPGGLARYKETKPLYQPLVARGNVTRHGLYEELWRQEVQIQRPWADIYDALVAGEWYVDAPDAARQRQADWCADALFGIVGGWEQFVLNALYSLITGFALFETVYSPRTLAIDKLAFRYSKQVTHWVMDADERELIAVRLDAPSTQRGPIDLPAHAVLLITHHGFGLDFEGNSPLRPVAQYAAQKAMFARLEQLAGEKYGIPILQLVASDASAHAAPDAGLTAELLDKMAAEDMVVIEMVDGRRIELVSPMGSMPSFEPIKRYCDEQMALAYRGEGNLLGLSGVGSYALAEVADSKAIRAALPQARRICSAINGSRGTPYTGVIRKMIDARYGPPPDGSYPELKWTLSRDDRPAGWVAEIGSAVQAGLLKWTPDDERAVREHLGLAADAVTDLTLSDDSYTPPGTVRKNARRALEVRASKPPSQRGMTEVGIARARDLSNGSAVSYETIKRMVAYFERHQGDKSGETWDEQGKGWQAWMGWGGDAGWSWAKSIVRRVEGGSDD
jgi:hypothetical protein